MSPLPTLLNVVSLIFLTHAVYSAYEHSLLPQSPSIASDNSSIFPRLLDPKISLPADIAVETIVSALLLCAGIVLGSPDLKPIKWNMWAGSLERTNTAREITEVGVGGGNPYAALEERPGFLDIQSAKRTYIAWAKSRQA